LSLERAHITFGDWMKISV